MPRININKEIGFGRGEVHDWDTDDDFVDMPLMGENYPFREGFRKKFLRESGEYYIGRRYRYKGINLFSYANRLVSHHLNQDVGIAYKKFCKVIKPKNFRWVFWNELERRYPVWGGTLCIDENKKIARSPLDKERLARWRNSKTKPYTFHSVDYRVNWVDTRTMDIIYPKHDWFTGRLNVNKSYCKQFVTSGYLVENVIPNSKLERQLKYEYRDKQRQIQRENKKRSQEITYSLLTQRESEIKAAKVEEKWRLQKRGFDEKSFRKDKEEK